MDWKNIEVSPDYIIDLVVFLLLAVVLIIVSKWLWELRERRRLQKEFAVYQTLKDDEAQEK
ncbi:MAG: hypothetical protein IKK57_12000 [Clostridia bacterium]|nr:hypothetical protein [Clostridia bacterium]